MRTLDELAVYYDRHALSQDGEPAQLDYRRIDLSRKTGYFHPKVILLLLDESAENADEIPEDEHEKRASEPDASEVSKRQVLIVGILSANLTRAGW